MLILCSCTLHQKKVKDHNRVQSTQAGISETFQFKGTKLQTCSCLFLSPSMSFQTWSGSFHSFLPRNSNLVPVVPLVPNFEHGANPRWPQVFRWSRWVEWSPGCEQRRLHQLVANDLSQEASMPCSLRKSWWRGGTEGRKTTHHICQVFVLKLFKHWSKQPMTSQKKKNINKPKRNVICCKSECINHMLRNQCFVNIRSTYCKTYHKNNNCNEYTLKSFLQEKAKYIYTLAQHAMYNQVYPIICLICL